MYAAGMRETMQTGVLGQPLEFFDLESFNLYRHGALQDIDRNHEEVFLEVCADDDAFDPPEGTVRDPRPFPTLG